VLLALLALVALLLALSVAVVGVGTWAWNSDWAQQRVLQQLPGLTLEAPRGRLNGGAFGVESLRWEGPELVVEIDDLPWADAEWRWRPHAGAWVGLTLAQPQASSVRVTRKPTAVNASEPLKPPSSLKLPLEALLQWLRLGSVQLDDETLLTALEADVHLGADGGARLRVEQLALTRAMTRASMQLKGRASIGPEGNLPLSAELEIHTELQGVQAAQLDTRAPAAALDGRVELALQGLALPGTVAPAAPHMLEGRVQTRLRGRLPALAKGRRPPPPMDLRIATRAFEKGLAAAGGTWQLLYRVAGRTTLRARAGVDNAVDVIWSWRWD